MQSTNMRMADSDAYCLPNILSHQPGVSCIYGHLHNGGYASRLSILNFADRRAAQGHTVPAIEADLLTEGHTVPAIDADGSGSI